MNMRTFERCCGDLALVPFVCLALCVPLRADEAPASKPNDAVPIEGTVDFGFPAQGTIAWNHNALHLAANADVIGAQVAQVDDVLRSHLGLGEGKGLVVTAVGEGTPAAKAGIQKNDVLIAVGSDEIGGLEPFRASLEASADKSVTIVLIRAGKKQSLDVTPHSTTNKLVYNVVGQAAAEPKYWLGVGLAGADDTLRAQLSLAGGEGLVVTSVENDSPSAKAGVLVNDLLLRLDGKSLTTIEALTEQLQTIADKSVALELLRRGKPATLTVTPEKHADAVAHGLAWFVGSNYAVDLGTYQALNLATNQALSLGTNQALNLNQYLVGVQYPNLNIGSTPARPELAKQLDDLDSQVRQLEAAIAVLRSTIEAKTQPPQENAGQGNADKK